MNIEKDKQLIHNMSTAELQEGLCMLEYDRMQAEHYSKQEDLQYIMLLIDAICGELIKRDMKAMNGTEPKWNIPKAPDTYYKLMALGDGSVSEVIPEFTRYQRW